MGKKIVACKCENALPIPSFTWTYFGIHKCKIKCLLCHKQVVEKSPEEAIRAWNKANVIDTK